MQLPISLFTQAPSVFFCTAQWERSLHGNPLLGYGQDTLRLANFDAH